MASDNEDLRRRAQVAQDAARAACLSEVAEALCVLVYSTQEHWTTGRYRQSAIWTELETAGFAYPVPGWNDYRRLNFDSVQAAADLYRAQTGAE